MPELQGTPERQHRAAHKPLFLLAAILAGSVALLAVFWRYEALQVEFLDLNFDSVHSTRTLLKTAILMTEVDKELRQLEMRFEDETLVEARAILDMAVAYEGSGRYNRAPGQAALRGMLHDLQSEIATLQRTREAAGTVPSQARIRELRSDTRQIVHQLENLERDRWGVLSSVNQELRDRMEHNTALAGSAAALFALILGLLGWSVTKQMRMERLLVREKQHLEREVAQRRQTEEALRQSSRRFRDLVDLSSDWFWEQDENLRFSEVSAGFTEQLGIPVETLLGRRRWNAVEALENQDWEEHRRQLENRESFRDLVFRARDSAGELRWVAVSGEPRFDEQGRFRGYRGTGRDITEARRLEHQLTHQATHDSLTDLVNRREFERRVERALESAGVEQVEHTLLYLDLDQFKVVNDTFGHMAGDELLRQLSDILRRPLRARDTLARLGGDEFGVLLEGCGSQPAQRIAERLRGLVADFVFRWNGRSISVGVSIGVVSFDGRSMSMADLLAHADAGCYIAKDRGRNAIHVYHAGDADMARRHGEMQWLLRIQQALQEERLCLFSQRIIGLHAEARDQSIELLVRMLDQDDSPISPGRFIPAAERYNLMPALDRWVFRAALSRLAEHLAGDPERAWEVALEIMDQAEEQKAVLSVLWHPHVYSEADFPGYGDVYEKILKEGKARGAEFLTAGEIVARRAVRVESN